MTSHWLDQRYGNRYAEYQLHKQPIQTISLATKSILLELAAELRNEIYEWVLLTPFEGDIITNDWRPPGLLGTCHQIREETRKLYWQRRYFKFDTVDCDGRLHVAWLKSFRWHCMNDLGTVTNLKVFIAGYTNGRNLMSWCEELYWLGGPVMDWFGGPWGSDDEVERVAAGAISMLVHGMSEPRSWEHIKCDLQLMMYALCAYDRGWDPNHQG